MAGPTRVLLVEEAARIDGGLVLVGVTRRQRRQRHRAAFALGPSLRGVREDAVDPGLQGRAPLKGVDTAYDREPRLLDDLVGNRSAAHIRQGKPSERRVMELYEPHKGRLVPASERSAQVPLAQLDSTHSQIGSTRISSRPSERTCSSRPKRWDWSEIAPTSAVAPSSGSSAIPANADPKRSVNRPRTTMR